jgi:hypothetical protein
VRERQDSLGLAIARRRDESDDAAPLEKAQDAFARTLDGKRKGFGWKRWSSAVVYGTWGLYRDYRVVYWSAKACPG